MKKINVLFLLLFVTVLQAVSRPLATNLWDSQKLAKVKKSIHLPQYQPAYNALIKKAESALVAHYATVMDKVKAPASGNKHDYMSLAIYFWPNPDSKDGLPYINKDGQRNPELKQYDAEPKTAMIDGVVSMTLAGYFSGDKKYSRRAAQLLDTWFLNPATRMNPNLDFAQHVPGRSTGRGYGIIDTYNFVSLTDAITVLNASGELSKAQYAGLKKWFSDFTTWLLKSKNGRDEAVAKNNHGTAYEVQLSACALFSGRPEIALEKIHNFAQQRIFVQITPDGSQPEELTRTLAFHYSWYNITHMIDMAAIAKHQGVDLLKEVSSDGRSIVKGLDFLTNYVGKKSEWKWQQIHDWDVVEVQIGEELRKLSSISRNPQYEALQVKLDKNSPDDICWLLYSL